MKSEPKDGDIIVDDFFKGLEEITKMIEKEKSE